MKVDIPYGKEKIKVNISEPFIILIPNKVEVGNQNKIIKDALEKPINCVSFEKFLSESKKLLVIVNDATRPTPTSKILDYIFPFISSHSDVSFIIATGTHRTPTDEERKLIFGKTYATFKKQIHVHDARKTEDMTYIGKTKSGTEIYINKLVLEYRNILVIGSIEPHYFAGYTGGRKSFLPGISSFKTVEMNHKFALNNKACSIALKGNPVHEDMVDAVNLLKDLNIFSIQVVLTTNNKLYAATAGNLHDSFNATIKYCNDIYCVPLKKKGNIVITAAPYPMDIDFYQSQKALDNGKLALEDDGIIILVSKCREGVGDDTFLDLLCKADTPKKLFDVLGEDYKLGYHKAVKIAELGMKAQIWAVTNLDDATVKKAMLKPYSNIQKAVDDAILSIKSKGKKANIILIPFGSLTIPLC
jgi:nickel-dependent lactate racemase